MKMPGLIATCSIVLLCAIGVTSLLEVQSTDEITTAIQEQNSVSQTITNNYDYSETHNHYENNDNDEKIEELEDKINELEEGSKEDEQVLIEVDEYNVVKPTQQQTGDPWRGPKSYKCNRMAGYPAICCYCGEQGEIHFNIKEWQDTQGTYHLTHVGCGQKYCDSIGVEPRIEESYKVK